MSDYNVVISEVDTAMDMLESFIKEVCDVHAHANFDVSSLFAMINQSILRCTRELDDLDDKLYEESIEANATKEDTAKRYCSLQDRLNKLMAIKTSCEEYGLSLIEQLDAICAGALELADDGLHEMGRYISKLNRINAIERTHANRAPSQNSPLTYVCVVDSARYPQTAEHIRVAQGMGFPSVLTLDRDNAADRRKASLEGVRINRLYDRDEYPCAVFREGGAGADVVYVEGSDNRGAGAYLRWQMQNMPDGAQVRIRVV